jgi:hypothetical protein
LSRRKNRNDNERKREELKIKQGKDGEWTEMNEMKYTWKERKEGKKERRTKNKCD